MDLLSVEIDRDLWRVEGVAAVQLCLDDDVLRREADQVRQRGLSVDVVVIEVDVALKQRRALRPGLLRGALHSGCDLLDGSRARGPSDCDPGEQAASDEEEDNDNEDDRGAHSRPAFQSARIKQTASARRPRAGKKVHSGRPSGLSRPRIAKPRVRAAASEAPAIRVRQGRRWRRCVVVLFTESSFFL